MLSVLPHDSSTVAGILGVVATATSVQVYTKSVHSFTLRCLHVQLSAVDGVTIYGPPPERRGSALARLQRGGHPCD